MENREGLGAESEAKKEQFRKEIPNLVSPEILKNALESKLPEMVTNPDKPLENEYKENN